MNKRFERKLSQILSIIILIIFVTTIISMKAPIWLVTYVWAFAFIIGWVLMLIFALHILLQKDSYGFSILTAIITALAFGLLSIPAILVLSRFIPQMPSAISFGNQFLNQNSQMILYTSLIVLYVLHLINSLKLRKSVSESYAYDTLINQDGESLEKHDSFKEQEYKESEKENINSSDNLLADNLKTDNTEINVENHNISNNDQENGEKIIFESNNDEKLEYNTEKVIFVEDLTDEDLINEEGEGNNG